MKRIFFIILTLIPVMIFASDHSNGDKNFDIVPRVVNFILIVSILVYFVKEPLKNAYIGRIKSISDRFDAVAKKLKDSKDIKEQAVKDLEIAKNRAVNLIEIAKKEAKNLQEKFEISTKNEIEYLEKTFLEQKNFEERKMKKAVINEILSEILTDETLEISQQNLVGIIEKKAS